MEQAFHDDSNPIFKDQDNGNGSSSGVQSASPAPMGRIGAVQSGMQPSGDRIDWSISDRLSDSSDEMDNFSPRSLYPHVAAAPISESNNNDQSSPSTHKCDTCGKNRSAAQQQQQQYASGDDVQDEHSPVAYVSSSQSSPPSYTTIIIVSIFGTLFLLLIIWLVYKFLGSSSSEEVSVSSLVVDPKPSIPSGQPADLPNAMVSSILALSPGKAMS